MKPGRRFRSRTVHAFLAVLAWLVAATWFGGVAIADPNQGPGGPILVITSPASTFGKYYAEILRNEGLNAFAVDDISTVTPAALAAYDVAVLAKMPLSSGQVTMLSDWVSGGGNLIAMAPDAQLAGLLGLTPRGTTLSNGYVLVDTSASPGNGIVNQTMQFHGSADRYTISNAVRIATLYSDATTSTGDPAVTLRSVAAGQAAAFTYDLATSVVYTRQGNPAWADQERDGFSPIRSDDKFFGNASGNPQPDWVDLNKVAIPQADEQQRLFANLIITMNLNRKPLPRFWYFPNGKKAVVVMTGDDHANGGTAGRFDQFIAASPPGCSLANWQCVRGTSYIYPGTPLTNSQAAGYHAQGFEVGLHINTNCTDFTPASLESIYVQQLGDWTAQYSSIPAPITQRHHCIVWSDWVTGAQVQLNHGIRLDTSYYYWPPGWINNVPGMFTGSAMPMRFAAQDGTLIDVYEATTHMTDESGQQYPFTVDTLLDRAVGAEGYYGAYVVNAHTDSANSPVADATVSSALARGVPVVSSRQMLDWLDGRNGSSFASLAWNGNALSFNLVPGSNTTGLQAMLPTHTTGSVLTSITRSGNAVTFSVSTIKGIEYASFPATTGAYVASFGVDTMPPTVITTSPLDGATGVNVAAQVTATFSEGMDPSSINGNTFELRDAANTLVTATVSYDSATLKAILTPGILLAASSSYTATVKGGTLDPRVKDVAGNALAANVTWAFTTAAAPNCPCSGWSSSATPGNPSVVDPGPLEVGVKFRSDLSGYITGVRFYKGSANTGAHRGNLWTLNGQQLATAIFTSETSTGWQQVNFATPVAITANTVYVASYYAPNGNYAADSFYFASTGVDNAPVHLLRDGVSGGNGVYTYGAASTFPNSTYQATNYWVDVVFNTVPGGDTTPPTVTAASPNNGATAVNVATTVTATFSEALDPASISASTFELRDPANALVAATLAYNSSTLIATLTPGTALAPATTYTATVHGGATDPRVKDAAGNALAANSSWSFTTAAAGDTTPPTVTSRSPATGAVAVAVATTVTATFSEAIDPATVGAGTFELRDPANAVIAATVTYTAATLTATLTPSSPLAAATTYTATVRGGATDPRVKDVAGNALAADVTWSFTTAVANPCPCSIWPVSAVPTNASDPDTTAVNLGVKFTAEQNGFITGIRFYKGAGNAGTHTGNLWSSSGTLLASATFVNETASGWQQVNFASPVAITANTVYVASYHAPVGRYADDDAYFAAFGVDNPPLHALRDLTGARNGVYTYAAGPAFPNSTYQATNYWVDVVFNTVPGGDTTPPTVTAASPNNGATAVNVATTVTATFSEALDPASISASTFELRDPANALVAATLAYNSSTLIATLTPGTALAPATTYTATVHGGATDPRVKDAAGNALAANSSWSFTTAAAGDTTPPTVTSRSPATGAVAVAVATTVTATFSEAIDPATVGAGTFELRDPANAVIAATVTYTAATLTATLTPSSPLAAATTYTATVRGGATDPRVKDVAGNALAADVTWSFTTAAANPCSAPANPIVAENCQTGNPASEWDITGVGDPSIQGFATDISVNRGSTVSFKVDTNATAYRFDVYRMGYYGGLGARKVASVLPTASLPQNQPNCVTEPASGLIDCGNWAVSGSWAVPANAVSGIYVARLVRTGTGGASHIVFIVRDDASTSDLLFQTSDTTWQAYNNYGGNSLYTGSPAGRAYKVTYNRPFNTRAVDGGQDWVFNAEYPMVRWLEANGYDVTYATGVDSDRSGGRILNHKTFLSVGHDEYWSGAQRTNVETARNAGVNLAFLSGNEIFWKTRWENSIDGSATPYRTLVSYKETHANAVIDPQDPPTWTGTWADPRFSPPGDGGRPQNALSGTFFMVNAGATTGIIVPAADGAMRLWRNTSIANLAPGATATLPDGTLGYEWDVDADNGARPPGLIRQSTTVVPNAPVLLDYGSNYGSGTATHSLTLYKHNSGARVFGAGTVQWSWGLDAVHDSAGTPSDGRMQQATVNLLADMNAQPATLQGGLIPASASTDLAAPTSTISSPTAGATLSQGAGVVISGTAADTGGVVGGVEVSVDGGTTWHPANGRANWTYNWTPSASGSITIKSRAVDDSGNLEAPGAGVTVSVGTTSQTCPCSIWLASAAPTNATDPDSSAVNLGVKFTAEQNGSITGIRFYKGAGNTGTHTGNLWSSSGTLLASATFANETASGWQQVNFASPVAITANTVYVASYHAPVGRYANDNAYFATAGLDNPPLHALRDGGTGGSNGVYAYAAGPAFPTSTFQATNYWVDVVFTNPVADTTPPTVTANTPANGATGVATGTTATATFSEAINPATINTTTFELRDPGNALVTATVAYNSSTLTATLTPGNALAPATTYTATVHGGATDPRVKDAAGNALAANRTWSFTTTATVDMTPPTVTARSPAVGATGVAVGTTVTATFSEAIDPATIGTTTFELRDPANALVTATVTYNPATLTATLTPGSALAQATTYTATVRGGAADPRVKDVAGNPLADPVTWSFTTIDSTAPTVTAIVPANNATNISSATTVRATFSEAMDSATVNTSTFELRDPANVLVPAAVSYDAATRIATLTPTLPLAAATRYTATVRGGATDPRVKDIAGNALAANRTWSFTIDATPPTVTAITPANGATGLATTTTVTATFSEVMNATTINTTTFVLRDSTNTVVTATVTYNPANRRATLTPSSPLAAATTYTATVKGGTTDPRVKDAAGNALAVDQVWSFTTDATPPTVTAITPASGATGVARTTTVTATFSEAMNATTINGTTFELRNAANVLVTATVTYNASNRRATLTPASTLAALTTYTATVKGGTADPRVKDVAGNALVSSRIWSFTTR